MCPGLPYMSLKSEKRCVIILENIFGFKGMTVSFEMWRPLLAAPPVSDVEYQAGGGKETGDLNLVNLGDS